MVLYDCYYVKECLEEKQDPRALDCFRCHFYIDSEYVRKEEAE